MDKDTKKLVKNLAAQGFTVKRTKKGHTAVYRDAKWITTLPGTASDWRSILNAKAALKRAGYTK